MKIYCPICERELLPESNWSQINYCRALALMPWILEHPGCSAWELSKESNIGYSQVSKALIKLRDLELVRADPEEREAGGFRYRYYPLGDHGEQEARLRRLAHAQDRTTAI